MENEEDLGVKFTTLQIEGDAAFKHEQYLEALTHYSDALSFRNDDEEVLGCRSAVYAKLGMFNESKKDAEKLIAVVPEKPKGHFLRAIALEHLGNFQECLSSYLKTYELDTRHPPELLLNIVQAAGRLSQLSDAEEIDLSTADKDAQKFEKLVQVGKRFHEDGRHHLCIKVISTALKAHYNLSEDTLYSEVMVDDMTLNRSSGKSKARSSGDDHGACNCAGTSMLSPVPGLSSAYLGLQEDSTNPEQVTVGNSLPNRNVKVLMSGFLTLAQAYFDVRKFLQALRFSKQCLSTALDFENKEYEIKAYVKLANTYHRLGNYLQAISTNAKLLAVGRDLSKTPEDSVLHEGYWNGDVERRAVWNLSAAYKFIGSYKQALDYANEYLEVLKYIDQENLTEAYSYLGELELLHGNHKKALECHKVELRLCKRFDNRFGMAYAYGSIGNVYATMRNFKVASVFHEQHKMLARTLSDRVSELVAVKHFGDMYKMMGDYTKALGFYDDHLKLAKVNKMELLQCKAYGHMGFCLWKLGQVHHAQYHFSLCLKMASDLGELEVELECKLSLAQIAKLLRQYETCRQYYNDVIPALEHKLLVREGQSAAYRAQLLEKLEECYIDLQEALIEMGRPDEALEIAEHCRSRCYVSILRHRRMFADNTPQISQELSAFSLSDIIKMVSEQDAVLVLYSVLHSGYVVWILSPEKGVVKFHHYKPCKHFSLEESIKRCVEELHGDSNDTYNCDHRALPQRGARGDAEQAVGDEKPAAASKDSACSSCEYLVLDALTPLQKAHKLLLGPFEEELTALNEERRKLVFIPDSILNSVPYPCLQTLSGSYLHERFEVRLLPCIRALSLHSQATLEQRLSSANESGKIVVAGNPDISTVQLNGETWKPNTKSDLTEQEVTTIASLLGVDPVVGAQATKDRILSSLSEASVVHLATFGSWAEGCLALAPNPHHHGNPPPEESFLLTSSDLLQLTLKTKLVVLSACCGCGRHYCQLKQVNFNLATALLACGVQTVVLPLWSTPHSSLMNLFYHFYSALEQAKTVSESLTESWGQLKTAEIFSTPDCWASHVVFGFDSRIDLPELRHQLFDKVLDGVVKEQKSTRFPVTTPALLDSKVQPVSIKVHKLKDLLSNLMIHHNDFPCVVPAVTDLVQLACQMLAACRDPELVLADDVSMCAQLSSRVLLGPHIRDFLSFLDFDLQKDGAKDEDPFVVFPHWDYDGTLEVAEKTLKAVYSILQISPAAGCAFARILKALTKNTMEKLREILRMTTRYPERIMKTTDFVLRSLWYSPDMQRYLTAIGFFEVGQSLLFKKSEDNQTLLKATFNTVSVLLAYCENEKPRTPSAVRELTSRDGRAVKLTTLSPRLTATKQIVMGTPWMSRKADADESALKVKLARELETINKDFAGRVTKSNYWHAQLLRNQSAPGTSLPVIGKSPRDSKEKLKSKPRGKLKVASGLTPSCNRKPVDPEPVLSITDTRERRNEIYRIYARRYDDIAMRKRHEIRHLFVSQVTDQSG